MILFKCDQMISCLILLEKLDRCLFSFGACGFSNSPLFFEKLYHFGAALIYHQVLSKRQS